jgi:uncharacterized membrane protein
LQANNKASEVKKRVLRLIKNSLVVVFTLAFVNILRPELLSFIEFTAGSLSISSGLILNVFTLLFIVYFGYFILIDLKFFLDFVSYRFDRKDRGKLQSVAYDIIVLISLALSSSLLSPFLASIQGVGETIVKIANIVLLAIGFFVFYHLVNQVYFLTKKQLEKLFSRSKHSGTSGGNTENQGDPT